MNCKIVTLILNKIITQLTYYYYQDIGFYTLKPMFSLWILTRLPLYKNYNYLVNMNIELFMDKKLI